MEVKLQTTPTSILVPSRVDESLIQSLQPSTADEYSISSCPANEFSFEQAKQKILNLEKVLPYVDRISLEVPDNTLGGNPGKLLRMGGIIEWNKQVSVYTPHMLVISDWLCGGIDLSS